MSYKVVLAESFRKSLKRLKKRFPQINQDVESMIEQLTEKPELGPVIPGGAGTRKVRVSSSDLKRGKRGGYRLIYYTEETPEPMLYLLLIYAKSDQADVSRQALRKLLDELE